MLILRPGSARYSLLYLIHFQVIQNIHVAEAVEDEADNYVAYDEAVADDWVVVHIVYDEAVADDQAVVHVAYDEAAADDQVVVHVAYGEEDAVDEDGCIHAADGETAAVMGGQVVVHSAHKVELAVLHYMLMLGFYDMKQGG